MGTKDEAIAIALRLGKALLEVVGGDEEAGIAVIKAERVKRRKARDQRIKRKHA